MPNLVRLVLLSVFILTATLGAALAQTKTFDELIEEALRRQRAAGAPPVVEQPPLAPEQIPIAPTPVAPTGPAPLPAAPPVLAPLDAGPRPYTPPTVEPAPGAATTTNAPDGTTPAAPGTEAAAGEPAERTRESLTPEEVNAALFVDNFAPVKGANPLVLKAQVLLDRAGASPGVVDAYTGDNLSKAIAAVETVLRLPADGVLDRAVWDALGGDLAPPALVQYAITAEDVAYPFAMAIPADYAEQARLPNLNYTSPEEMFGERFHMDVKLLTALNPGANFRQAGATIWVAAVTGPPITGKIARIAADKQLKQVRAYDAQNRLIVAYPATIGSPDNPSPSGEHQVKGVAPNPVYYYDPKNFVQGANTEKLQLPAGPNSPVGSMWIDLTEPSYGIHGTPEPTKIDKTGSHGCVRLTNWDAEELAGLVEPGVIVSFTE